MLYELVLRNIYDSFAYNVALTPLDVIMYTSFICAVLLAFLCVGILVGYLIGRCKKNIFNLKAVYNELDKLPRYILISIYKKIAGPINKKTNITKKDIIFLILLELKQKGENS